MLTGNIFTLIGKVLWEIGGIGAAAETQLDLRAQREYEPSPASISARPGEGSRRKSRPGL